jgi:tetratricopeptide (TPR) repeat protein
MAWKIGLAFRVGLAGGLLALMIATAGCAIGAEPESDAPKIGETPGSLSHQEAVDTATRVLDQLAQGENGRRAPGALGAYLAGLHADRENDYSTAADLMSAALSRDPGNIELLHRTLILLASEGRFREALDLAPRMTGAAPNHVVANLLVGVDSALAGSLRQAETAFARMPQQGSSALARPLLEAWLAAAEENAEKIQTIMAPLQELKGFEPLVHLHRGMMYELAGRPLTAMSSYETAIAANERTSLRIVLRAGRFFEREGERERALALYRGYANANPGSALIRSDLARAEANGAPPPVHDLAEGLSEALFNMASLLSQENAADMALIYAHLALHADPGMEVARVLIAEILQRQDRPREAIAAYETLRDSEAFGFLAAVNIASELHELGRTDEAETRLRDLGERYPGRYDPYLRIGNMLRSEERFAEAADAYDEAVARLGEPEPRHWTLFYFRGIALERSDQWSRAEGDFLRALELQPEQPYVMNYLAYSWVEQKMNLDRAQEMLRDAVRQEPDDGYIVDSLGWVYYRLGKYEDAVSYLERAVELRPQDPIINDHLGDAYWRVGRTREATVQWQRALSLDPEEDRIQEIEQKLRDGLKPAETIGSEANDT